VKGSRALRVALGAIALLLVLPTLALLTAPAGLASRLAAASAPGVRLFAPSGRLLDGSADLVLEGRAVGRLTWSVQAGALLTGRLQADLAIDDPGHSASAELTIRPSGAFHLAVLAAEIHEQTLDALLRPYAIEPSGSIEVAEGAVSGRLRERRVTEADADARWSGGLVRYQLGGAAWTASFPPLLARLRVRDGAPVLVVEDTAGAELLDVALRPDGWADLRVRYRFVALAGYPWPDPPAPDVIVVEISEQLL
jgi:hypothetical protein